MTKPTDLAFPANLDIIRAENAGLTVREFFAACAMQGFCAAWSDYHAGRLIDEKEIAADAVGVADALIAELSK